MNLKQVKIELLKLCVKHVEDTIETNNKCLTQLREAVANESKSTAGDKHETGRAMINLEQENVSKQMLNVIQQKAVLDKIDLSGEYPKVRLGALLISDKIKLFFAIAKGKISIQNQDYYVVSLSSPIGRQFANAKVNDSITFNGNTYNIQNIV